MAAARQRDVDGSMAASAAVAAARSAVAGHSATAAARWKQHGGCGGGGSATAQRRWQHGSVCECAHARDDTTDYDRGLPESFPRRPSLGARLFVRANASRFFLALLGELSNWKGHIRHRSAKVLLILTVYCEEHLTKDFHHTIASIAKAIGMDISSQGEGDSMMKLEPIRRVLRLMAKYVDPVAYLPLLCPRILGDNSSATSDSRRNYAIALSSLIEGSPIHRLTLHWSDVASLLSDTDCIGPFVGTQTRRQCLTAFHTLIAMVTTSKGCAASFVSQLADAGELGKLRSVLSSSNAALEEMMRKVSGCDEDAKLGRGCIDGISENVSAAAAEM